MKLSTRNQLRGKVKTVTRGSIMAEVVVALDGGQELVSVITRGSADRLGLEAGDSVTALVKATEVMIGK